MLYAPSRVQLARKDGVLQGSSTASLTLASPQVRVQNREIEQSRNRNGSAGINAAWSASVAGDYYVALQLEPLQAYLSGRAMPVLMNVAVDGEASGAPTPKSRPPGRRPNLWRRLSLRAQRHNRAQVRTRRPFSEMFAGTDWL